MIKWTTKGRIEVRKAGALISSHTSDREAWESVVRHSEANGAGKYVVSYPNVEVDVVPITVVSTDTQAPTQPGSFDVQAPPTGGILLQWLPSTDGPPGASGGSGLRGYRVWRALSAGGPFTQIALVEKDAPNSYQDGAIGENQTRYYFVDAVDNAGNVSAPTATLNATSRDITPPSTPAITAAALGATAIQITLATPSTDASAFAYTLEYKRSVDSTWAVVAVGLTNPSFPYLVSSLTASTSYDFRLRATDAAGNIGFNSATATAQTQSGGPAQLVLWRTGRTTVGLFASAVNGAHYYKIRWRPTGSSGAYTYARSPAQWLVAVGLTTGVSYDFQYLTTDDAGVEVGAWSNTVSAAPVAGKVDLAEAPRVYVDTKYVAPTGTDYPCNNVAQVQAALAACTFGDSITLNAANTFDFGDQALPNKGSGSAYIHIRSSLHALLPGPGVRVGPEHAGFMPKLRCASGNSVMLTVSGTHHFRLLGLDFSWLTGNNAADTLLYLDNREPLAANTAHHMIVDRCYMHTDISQFGTYGIKRCVSAGGDYMAVIDSYLDHQGPRAGTECHAIAAFGGNGPIKIRNCFLQASSINVLIGGAAPAPTLTITKDIEVWGNYFKKNPAWKYLSDAGGLANVKNLLEFKWGQRAVSGGGIFDTNWAGGQAGETVLIGLQGENLSPEWNKCTDIAFYDIDGKDWCGGFQLTERSNSGPLVPDGAYHDPAFDVERVTICNVRTNLTGEWANGTTDAVTSFHPSRVAPHDFLMDHVTFGCKTNARTAAFGPQVPSHALTLASIQEAITKGVPYWATLVRYTTIENSILPHGLYGISGGAGYGKDALNNISDPACPWSVKNTVLFDWAPSGVSASVYGAPMVNVALPNMAAVGFTDYANANYALLPSSPYKNAATDGKDIGCLL